MAKPASEQAKDKAKEVADNNGVENPSQAGIALFSLLYLAFVPATSFISNPSTPVLPSLIGLPLKLIPGLPKPLPLVNSISAYSAFYGIPPAPTLPNRGPYIIETPSKLHPSPCYPTPTPINPATNHPTPQPSTAFWAFGATGAFSAAGQGMARPSGLDNLSPRAHVHNLRGLPLKLRSAHYNLLENFAGYALAAALAVATGGADERIVNLLGLHVLLKCVVYYGAYLADVAPVRTLSHVLATSAVVDVLWRLARGQ